MLTYTEIRDAARKTYEAGTLLAQGDYRAVSWDYGYEVTSGDETRRCAIGAALTRAQIDAISEQGLHRLTVNSSISAAIRDLLDIEPASIDDAASLQSLHDAWMGAERDLGDSREERDAFVEALYAD